MCDDCFQSRCSRLRAVLAWCRSTARFSTPSSSTYAGRSSPSRVSRGQTTHSTSRPTAQPDTISGHPSSPWRSVEFLLSVFNIVKLKVWVQAKGSNLILPFWLAICRECCVSKIIIRDSFWLIESQQVLHSKKFTYIIIVQYWRKCSLFYEACLTVVEYLDFLLKIIEKRCISQIAHID